MSKFVCGVFVGVTLVFTHALCYVWGQEDKLEKLGHDEEPEIDETVENEGEES